ncbi:hypothetical protein [Algoriella sp.]|uniref:hypothetical protein n=1 Tax=Algoriella sp. TaxID=1872434 RepID=UPI002FCA8E65
MKCIKNAIKLGCFSACEPIPIGIKADIPGEWRIEINFMNIVKVVKKNYEANEELIINEKLNEDFTYLIQVFNPNNELQGFYSFKTYKTCY